MKKSIVLAAIVVATGIIYCPSASAQAKKQQTVNVINEDESMITTNEDDAKYEIRMKGKSIVELKVNGELISKADYPKYETKVQKILARVEKDRLLADEDRRHSEQEMRITEKQRERAHEELRVTESQRKQAEKDREHAMAEMERTKTELKRASEQMAKAEEDRTRIKEETRLISERTKEVEIARKQAEKARANAELARQHAEEDRKLLDEMFAILIDSKIVSDRDDIKSIELDETTLLVNGIKQSNTIHADMLKKSKSKGHKSISYKNDDGGTRFSVDN